MTVRDDNHLPSAFSDEGMDAFHRFYKTRLGHMTRHLISSKLKTIIDAPSPSAGKNGKKDDRIAVGLGYARPYLRLLDSVYGQVIGLQSAGIEAVQWPRKRPSRMAVVDESQLPVPASSLDTLLLVHALEIAPDQPAFLDECWRVLKSQARLVLVVPHRGSMWAGSDTTPFGYGQPYSVNQIRSMLKTHGFEVGKVHRALAVPPSHLLLFPRIARLAERFPYLFGGVLIVDARKMIYSVRGLPVADRKRILRPALIGINSGLVPGIDRRIKRQHSKSECSHE